MKENKPIKKQDIAEEKNFSDKCCDIYNAVFSSYLTYETFWYKHYGNPHRLSTPMLVEKVDNDIAGINGFLAVPFICKNDKLFAAQSCDSAVLNKYKGKGIFSSIIKRAQTQLKADDVDFLFGFPNQYSYPGFIKLGWKHTVDFSRFFLPINCYAILQNKIGKTCAHIIHVILKRILLSKVNQLAKKTFNGTINSNDLCPFTKEDFAIINNCDKIMTKRNIECYDYKLDNNPTKKFKYITARTDGRLCGFLAYHVLNDEVNVVDWLCVQHDNNKIVMAKLIKHIINVGAKINIPLINIKSEEVKLLKSLGFWNSSNIVLRRKMSPLVIYIINKTLDTKLHVPEKWLLRYIDSDTIIS